MRFVEKQLRFVERSVCALFVGVLVRLVSVHLQQIGGELPLCEGVVKELRVVQVSLEVRDDGDAEALLN